MKYVVGEECIGCGMCTSLCENVFSFGDEGKAVAIEGDVDAADEETAAEACQNCPVGAISEADNSNLERKRHMSKYQCGPCGYIYDPEIGDPDSGIAPGTAFEDIPDDWVCPVCSVGKDDFSEA